MPPGRARPSARRGMSGIPSTDRIPTLSGPAGDTQGGADMSQRHVVVPGGRLFVVDEGPGPPVVLLHAGIADIRSWDAMIAPLVGAGYRAVRYDQRGVGHSTTEPVDYSRIDDLLAVMDAT